MSSSRPEVIVFWGESDAAVSAEARHEVGRSVPFVWRCDTVFPRQEEYLFLLTEDNVGICRAHV